MLMTEFNRFFLADRLYPAIELSDGRMLLLSNEGDWNEINSNEILNDERSPQVGIEDLEQVLDRLGFKFPEAGSGQPPSLYSHHRSVWLAS